MKEDFLNQDKESIEKERFDAITQIAATINHEINTPLMVVLLNLELLLQEENGLNKKIVNKLKIIHKESQKIRNVTRKLANITINPNIFLKIISHYIYSQFFLKQSSVFLRVFLRLRGFF